MRTEKTLQLLGILTKLGPKPPRGALAELARMFGVSRQYVTNLRAELRSKGVLRDRAGSDA